MLPPTTSQRSDAWFRVHPVVAVWVSVALFVAIAAARFAIAGSAEPLSGLYSLPIALLALAFGRKAGLAGGVAAVGLLALWTEITDIAFTPLGWASRATPLILLGALVGSASDHIRAAQARERHMAAVAALQREAAEVQDSLVQGLTVAKWLLEANELDRGLEAVTETMMTAQALVSQMLGADSPLPGDPRRSRAVPLAR